MSLLWVTDDSESPVGECSLLILIQAGALVSSLQERRPDMCRAWHRCEEGMAGVIEGLF
jgi:hypothetical protein